MPRRRKKRGVWTLAWEVSEKGTKYVSSGIIEIYKRPYLLAIDKLVYINPEKPVLGPMHLRVSIERRKTVSFLMLEQSGYKYGPDWDWYYEAVKKAWPYTLELLKKYAEKISYGGKN